MLLASQVIYFAGIALLVATVTIIDSHLEDERATRRLILLGMFLIATGGLFYVNA